MTAVIDFQGVTRRDGGLVRLDALDLQVDEGEVLALLGHNGAGKTTTMHLILGLLSPSEGQVAVLGGAPDGAHAETLRRVPVRPLAAILDAAERTPDFVSLDIEGGEVAALSSFPFDRHPVRVWAIENNTRTPEIRRIMEAAGHRLVEFCGQDEIWLKT